MEISFKKYLLSAAIGFGIGGMIWGIDIYFETIGSKDVWANPFSYILGAISLGIFGSLSLVLFSKNLKKILKVVGIGLLGWIFGFLAPAVVAYQLAIGGAVFLAGFLSFLEKVGFSQEYLLEFSRLFALNPAFDIGNFWIEFFLTATIIGLIYALVLKTKIWSVVWRGGVGFGTGSLMGPIIGNLIGNLFNSLLISYLITFSMIGIILGLFLAWGIYRNIRRSNL